jgi:hypothetical protein
MRVSLEKKIEYLARVSNFKIKKRYWECILVIFENDEVVNTFKSKSINRIINQAYEYINSRCKCVRENHCTYCK